MGFNAFPERDILTDGHVQWDRACSEANAMLKGLIIHLHP
jgi:hypothetical protein